MNDQQKISIVSPVIVSILVAIAIWYFTSFACLSDTRDTYVACEVGHTSIVFFTWLIMIGGIVASRKRVLVRSAAGTAPAAVSKKHQWAGFLLCTVPLMLVSLGFFISPTAGYIVQILAYIAMVIGWISILPAFVFGIILLNRKT